MYARVARFTGVTSETVEMVKSQVESGDGPPPGIDARSMKLMFDSEQGTSLFVAFFDTEEAMAEADRVLGSMDNSETPGTRASVDRCVVALER